jgi:hypothetical protein
MISDEYIAESQRLSIAQNKTLKFLYQTWWAWWLPRLVSVVLIIVFYVLNLKSTAVLLGVFVSFSFAGEWFGQRNLAKARQKVRTRGTTTTVSMSDQGVDIDGANGNSHLKWSALLQPVIYTDGVLIRLSRLAMLWLPDQALTDGSPGDVRNLLAENVKESPRINQ